MTHTLTVPRSLEHIVETECSPRVVAMSSYLYTLVLMSCVSVTISYSFRCLTTETVKYTSFIENLAASKYSYVGTERETNVIINNKCTFCIFRGRAALCAK